MKTVNEIKRICNLGCGTMGFGTAIAFAQHGYEVNMFGRKDASIDRAMGNIRATLAIMKANELLTDEGEIALLKRIHGVTTIEEAAKDADFVLESVAEDMAVKQQVYRELEGYLAPDIIFATDSSGFLPTEASAHMAYPERFVVAHFWNPPHLIPLVELTSGDKTDPALLRLAYDFYQSIGKEAVLLRRECPGFIANRLQLALYREVQDLVMRGVCSVEDADKALVYGPGLRWAIFGHNMIMQLGNPGGLTGMVNMLGNSGDRWLADMASWTHQPDNWAEVAQPGVDEEMKHFPDHIGHTNEACAAYRDQMLIELLKLHKKL